MPRDPNIKRTFEVADDAMQGAIGYFLYGIACHNKAPVQEVLFTLPPTSIPITHDWDRHYQPSELCEAMRESFLPYHARVSMIAVISAFEAAITRFEERLAATGKIQRPSRQDSYYKRRLQRIFEQVRQTTYGTLEMRNRIPTLCLDVDHARRIRNLWMHHNGLFGPTYKADAIQIPGHNPIVDPSYVKFVQKRRRSVVPIVLTNEGFFGLAKSHIELLYQVHDTIQRKHFGQIRAYSYRQLKKPIEWHALLLGAPARVLARYKT